VGVWAGRRKLAIAEWNVKIKKKRFGLKAWGVPIPEARRTRQKNKRSECSAQSSHRLRGPDVMVREGMAPFRIAVGDGKKLPG